MNIVDFLTKAKIFASKGEVRKMISNGGLKIDGIPATFATDLVPTRSYEVLIGKSRRLLAKVES